MLDVRHDHSHVATLSNESISPLAPFSALIITISAVIIFLIRLYVLESWLLPRLYGSKYTDLSDTNRRSFVNHHVAGGTKLVLLFSGAYPFISMAFGHGTPHSPFGPSHLTTLGDVAMVCSQIFTVMYIFELFYRTAISPISAAHHIGAIVIAQTAVALTLGYAHDRDATDEFILCLVWGAFDVVAEFYPHVAMIIYRVRHDDHLLLERIFKVTCGLEVAGTVIETAVVMWLFGSLWSKWRLAFKVVTPVLHVLFSLAQIWGAVIFNRLRLREKEKRKSALV
ncbi:hypothetical protein EDD37DRAFT_649558 [Exophiala viscosa]|uniref:uncharacterized protein n=1 Tax=Exophiala viscosa TaxID=2486360 RepID=UPI0021998166|nr:hypothetical protein EDD37DRAFT_649558 [Exophiala viscosa]